MPDAWPTWRGRRGLSVRGVMGYEGHVVGLDDRATRERLCEESMQLLRGGARAGRRRRCISAGGTGTYDCNRWANEIQAGSYALMDTAYAKLALPFRQALSVLATVISVSAGYAVADCGLKALGMDHGNPTIDDATVLFCSDEHITFVPGTPVRVGDRIRVWPAHIDPTVAYHERLHVISGERVDRRLGSGPAWLVTPAAPGALFSTKRPCARNDKGEYQDHPSLMKFQTADTITHPATQVLDIMIQRIEAIVPYLPNIERIETLESKALRGGRHHIIRRWQASSDQLPATLRPFISTEWLAWLDDALWTPAEHKVDWSLSTKLGRLYDCSGTNYIEPDPSAPEERTRIRITGSLTVYPDRVPGIPALVSKRLAPLVERFIINLITPNLTSVAKGLDGYLRQEERC